jgi:hypothetical protein
MLVNFYCYHYLCGFKDIKEIAAVLLLFSKVLCCCFCWISSWSVEALFLLSIIDLWSIYAELLIPLQVVVLQNVLNAFFLIYRGQVSVAVVATV